MCAQIVAHVVCGTGVAKEKKNLGDFIWKITLFLENVSVGFLAFYAISVLILGAKTAFAPPPPHTHTHSFDKVMKRFFGKDC